MPKGSNSSSSSLPLIKGYLPVRLSIPRNHALEGVDHAAENDEEIEFSPMTNQEMVPLVEMNGATSDHINLAVV